MKKSIIIIDLDGTAVDVPDKMVPSKRLIDATAKLKKDYFICAATGRSQAWAREVVDPMNIKDLCIVSGGTSIFDPVTDSLVWRQSIDSLNIEKIKNIMKQSGAKVLFNDYPKEEYYSGGWNADSLNRIDEAYFMELVFAPKDIADEAARQASLIDGVHATVLHAQKPDLYDVHIVHEKATKEHAIHELYKMLGVTAGQSIGVGDGLNDIHLFNAVNHKVAMGNAADDLKILADEIIGSVKDDGLAEYFENLAQS